MSTQRVPAASFPRATIVDLAEALGVHRNTVTAWLREGAPAGPPFCELAWRTWAAAAGKPCATAPEQALLEMLAAAGIATYRRQLQLQRQVVGGGGGMVTGGGTGGNGQADIPPAGVGGGGGGATDWDQENKRLQAQQRQLELDKARRRLISIEELHDLVEAIGEAGKTVFNDAPRLAHDLPLGPDDRQRVQASLEAQLAVRREQLVAGLRDCLKAFLERKGA